MPVAAYNDFLLQLQMLNYEQSLNAMKFLIDKIQMLNSENYEQNQKKVEIQNFFDFTDGLNLSSNEKWTREE